MTLLIIGGMLLVALLAILGAVFLSVSDQRAAKTQVNGNVTETTSGTRQLVEPVSAATPVPERTALLSQNVPSTSERPVSPTAGSQQQYALNGQFHELTVELQTLYQHAWELERRLRTLSEVADRLEKTQGNQIGTEEGMRIPSSTDSINT